MANLENDNNLGAGRLDTTTVGGNPTVTDTETRTGSTTRVYETPARTGSGIMPYLIGGLVIAAGLFAFLFYDRNGSGRDVSTTGSTAPRIESPAAPGGGAAGTNRGTVGTTGSTTGGAATGTTPAR